MRLRLQVLCVRFARTIRILLESAIRGYADLPVEPVQHSASSPAGLRLISWSSLENFDTAQRKEECIVSTKLRVAARPSCSLSDSVALLYRHFRHSCSANIITIA